MYLQSQNLEFGVLSQFIKKIDYTRLFQRKPIKAFECTSITVKTHPLHPFPTRGQHLQNQKFSSVNNQHSQPWLFLIFEYLIAKKLFYQQNQQPKVSNIYPRQFLNVHYLYTLFTYYKIEIQITCKEKKYVNKYKGEQPTGEPNYLKGNRIVKNAQTEMDMGERKGKKTKKNSLYTLQFKTQALLRLALVRNSAQVSLVHVGHRVPSCTIIRCQLCFWCFIWRGLFSLLFSCLQEEDNKISLKLVILQRKNLMETNITSMTPKQHKQM